MFSGPCSLHQRRVLIQAPPSAARTGPISQPRILLTHIPLYRPEGTSCGRMREASRPIRQGTGRNYQNELDERTTKWLMDRIRPSLVYSGDDHDSCVYATGFTSPLDGRTPVTETTVKAFVSRFPLTLSRETFGEPGLLTGRGGQSMAMGVQYPGYHLLSLYAPLPPSDYPADLASSDTPVSYTYTQTNCTLPDQIGTYLHLYLPLAACFFVFLFVPKLAAAIRAYFQRKKHRRAASARTNGLPSTGAGTNEGGSRGGGKGGRAGHFRTLSQKLANLAGGGTAARRATTAEEDADVDDAESQFPALLGGVSHLDASPYSNTGVSESDSDLDDYDGRGGTSNGGGGGGGGGSILPTSMRNSPIGTPARGMSEKGANGRGGQHVRRVSRVWLWEGSSSRPGSPRDSMSLGSHSVRSGGPFAGASLFGRVSHLLSRLVDRLISNSLLSPMYRRFVRPIWRSTRSTWRKVAAPLASVAGGHVGGPVGQALAEAIRDLSEIAWPAVTLWCVHVLWYLW